MTTTPTNINLTRYAADPDENRVQTEAETAKASRTRMFGIISADAIKTMDKRHFSVVADATLDEVVDAFYHLFSYIDFCDTCEEPATRIATFRPEDKLDRAQEMACDVCKFSKHPVKVKVHPQAQVVHRVKGTIALITERR